MREQIDTIPVNDAFNSEDECPFCFLERQAEKSVIRYVAGPCASYMEPDVRGVTDRVGFCREHTKKLYDYGNTLGAALMLQTHYAGILEEFRQEKENFQAPEKPGLFRKKKPQQTEPYWKRIRERENSCYICNRIEEDMERYYRTFFVMIKDPEFREKVETGKGFCMCHFSRLLEMAEDKLPSQQREWFYKTVFERMEENLSRVKLDLDWLISKYDYRNAGADWKNSRDALPRAMQKIKGVLPSEPVYKMDE